ncbi:GcvT family protein [Dongia sedimenti]|uniref:FAD-dependent oxidoreductase n=1 Tax=Dongia sedimenti TaxID=3064282 RepID=A0ABU0YJK7_9PROT|nr:FAD-dependent oxidoreductase [Rhodospirillaceae bacterium R-7]
MAKLPSQARAVIIGGGIIGCSTAYHLAGLGWKDIVLIERNTLTSGSTWHAAGLVGQLRTSANITQLLKYSVELYDKLEQETGLATGWKMNGGLRLACNAERMTEIRRQATTAHSFGLEMELLSPQEALKLWPLMDVSDLVGAAFLPTDGQANPADIAQSLAKGARNRGVTIVEETRVIGIKTEKGRATGVVTDKGEIACEVVVNCAGQWARQVGALAGVSVPLQAVQHQYIVTEALGAPKNLPTLRDPDRLIYFKEEVGGLVMGGYEHNPVPWLPQGDMGDLPENFAFQLLENDLEHFEPLLEQALARVPALASTGIKQIINGPESFTPDGNFILGEAPELENFFVGAGFNAFGIASGGGAGRALAEWVAGGEPPMDLWAVDIRRFGALHRDRRWVLTRTLEAYAHHYSMAWPYEELTTGRPLRVSPLYERLKAQGAVFGSKLGWERPNWFAPQGVEPWDVYTYERQNWFDHVGAEHKACREKVALFDQTSFAKFLLLGQDAEAALSWICSNDVAKQPGSLVYTQMLNARGGIECDLTVTRRADDAYYIVTGTGFATHDFHWIRSHIPEGLDARLVDVSGAFGALALMGPRAREVLQAVAQGDLSNQAFPFGTAQEIMVSGAPVFALRVTYVGELGWELHIPMDSLGTVYEALMQAGKSHGIVNAGYRAIESLRLEKFYRAWSSDISPDHSPLEAGMAWAVKLKKNTPFLGREALVAQAAKKLPKLLACFTVDDQSVVLLGRETIFRNGKQVGWLSSGGYGYTLGTNIGIGYVRDRENGVTPEEVASGSYELEIACKRYPAKVSLQPLYDPKMERVKA